MYALTAGRGYLHKCGKRLKTAGAECEHNTVDGDATLAFVLDVLTQIVERLGGREALRGRLLKLAKAQHNAAPDSAALQVQRLEQPLSAAEAEVSLIGRNLARAKDEAEGDLIRQEWHRQKREVEQFRNRLEAACGRQCKTNDLHPAAQVERALALYDETTTIVQNPTAKAAMPGLLEKINLRLWLSFREGAKGERKV
jgi:hypothetical protein